MMERVINDQQVMIKRKKSKSRDELKSVLLPEIPRPTQSKNKMNSSNHKQKFQMKTYVFPKHESN